MPKGKVDQLLGTLIQVLQNVFERLRNSFITGVIVAVPFAITLYIIFQLFVFADSFLGDAISDFMGRRVPGVGLISTALLFIFAGLVAQNVIGNRLVHWLELSLERLPFVRSLYIGIKQVWDVLFNKKQWDFQRVVLVEYPKSNSYALGFVTGTLKSDQLGNHFPGEMTCVFVPTTPNPTSGFLLLLSPEKILETHFTVEEAMKLIISGGLVKPGADKPPDEQPPFEAFTIPH